MNRISPERKRFTAISSAAAITAGYVPPSAPALIARLRQGNLLISGRPKLSAPMLARSNEGADGSGILSGYASAHWIGNRISGTPN